MHERRAVAYELKAPEVYGQRKRDLLGLARPGRWASV